METYQLECTCGDVIEVNAENREDAIAKLRQAMSQAAISTHYMENHPGEEVPNVEEVHDTIRESLMHVPTL